MNKTALVFTEGRTDSDGEILSVVLVPDTFSEADVNSLRDLAEYYCQEVTEVSVVEKETLADVEAYIKAELNSEIPAEGLQIHAEVHTDDLLIEVSFLATPYFEHATNESLLKLAACGWGGDYPADNVVIYMAEQPGEGDLSKLFSYLELVRATDKRTGFECHVNEEDARAWLALNRPDLLDQIDENQRKGSW